MVKDLLERAEKLKLVHVLKPDIYQLVEGVMKIYQEKKEREGKS